LGSEYLQEFLEILEKAMGLLSGLGGKLLMKKSYDTVPLPDFKLFSFNAFEQLMLTA
jgi:hypothetical protein